MKRGAGFSACGNLGRGVPVAQLRKSTVGGWSSMPPPTDNADQRGPALIVTQPTEAEAKSPPKSVEVVHARDDKAGRSDRPVPPIAPAAHHERAMFEARRDTRLAELQAEEARQARRKRNRPRGKVRRLE